MKPHRFALSLLILLLCQLVTLPARAFDCGPRPIRLAFYETGFFYFENAKGPQGIDKEIVDELIKRSGCQIQTQLMVRARIWADLASGELDMSVSGIQNPERDRFAWFAPYLSTKNYAILGKRAAKVHSAQEFIADPQLTFGVVRAFKHGTLQDGWLAQLRSSNRVQESPDADSIFKKLKEQRVDAMFSQPPVYRKRIQDLQMQSEVQVQDWTPDEKGVPLGLIMAKSFFSQNQAAQWRNLLDAMRKDGTLKRIYEHYLPAAEAARLLDF
ncbi:MAG: hypothetical protein RL748_3540 [Pseudomonadota bacterium]|jgi:polar amino acid transport system substrate-binding protein